MYRVHDIDPLKAVPDHDAVRAAAARLLAERGELLRRASTSLNINIITITSIQHKINTHTINKQ